MYLYNLTLLLLVRDVCLNHHISISTKYISNKYHHLNWLRFGSARSFLGLAGIEPFGPWHENKAEVPTERPQASTFRRL